MYSEKTRSVIHKPHEAAAALPLSDLEPSSIHSSTESVSGEDIDQFSTSSQLLSPSTFPQLSEEIDGSTSNDKSNRTDYYSQENLNLMSVNGVIASASTSSTPPKANIKSSEDCDAFMSNANSDNYSGHKSVLFSCGADSEGKDRESLLKAIENITVSTLICGSDTESDISE